MCSQNSFGLHLSDAKSESSWHSGFLDMEYKTEKTHTLPYKYIKGLRNCLSFANKVEADGAQYDILAEVGRT